LRVWACSHPRRVGAVDLVMGARACSHAEQRKNRNATIVSNPCSGYEAGSYLRLIDFVHHATLGLRV